MLKIAASFIFLFSIIIFSNIFYSQNLIENSKIEVTFIDVGQGDSTFINLFSKYYILIDTGPMDHVDLFFQEHYKKRGVKNFLKKNNIKKIDYLIITHPHIDHIGNLYPILKTMKVKNVLDVGIAYPSIYYNRCLELIEQKKINYKIVRKDYHFTLENVNFQVLHPDRIYYNKKKNANLNSLVLKLTYKDIRFLFTGDITSEIEKILVTNKLDLKANFLKAPHQGSEFSNSSLFLEAVQADAVIISSGKFNPFGHPNEKTLKRISKSDAKIYRTDIDGNVQVITDGKNYEIIKEK